MKKLRISQIQFQAKSTPDENAKLLKTNFLISLTMSYVYNNGKKKTS